MSGSPNQQGLALKGLSDQNHLFAASCSEVALLKSEDGPKPHVPITVKMLPSLCCVSRAQVLSLEKEVVNDFFTPPQHEVRFQGKSLV